MPVPTAEEINRKNLDTINYFAPYWLNNYRENAEYINRAMKNGQVAHDIPFNDKKIQEKGVVIIASGPSVYAQREYLKELNEFFVMCSPTNYAFCLAHGLVPDVIVMADSNSSQIYDLFSVLKHHPNTNILAPPHIHPLIHTIWDEKKIYWTKTYVQSQDGTLKNHFNEFQAKLFSNVSDHVLQAGNVTNMALIAVELFRNGKRYEKHPKVFLIGYDLAFNKTAERIPRYFQEANGMFTEYPLPRGEENFSDKCMIKHQGIFTNTQMYGYRRSLVMLWVTVPWQMWTCSSETLLTEVPYFDIEDLIQGKLPEPLPDEYRHEMWKSYQSLPAPTTVDGRPLDACLNSMAAIEEVPKEVTSNLEVQ